MHAVSTFAVTSFDPTDYACPVTLAAPVGHALMTKEFTGDLAGRWATLFSGAYDQVTNSGAYVAFEAFEGTLGARAGTFGLTHGNVTAGGVASRAAVQIAPATGTGELAGISGTGQLWVDDDGGHHLELDYELPGR